MHTYLRIAFSATCLITCVLLIALWVRSRDHCEWFGRYSGKVCTSLGSDRGKITLRQIEIRKPSKPLPSGWQYGGFVRSTNGIYYEESLFDEGVILRVPHWFLVLLSATLAAVPWVPWSKRFRLRTLLIGTTLMAVVLGMVVYAARS